MKKFSLLFLIVTIIAGCSPVTPAVTSEFPLHKGTTWTYSYKAYEPSPTDPAQVAEATYQMTETVTETETVSSYFVAHVKRDYQRIDVDPGWTGDFEASRPNEYWYIVDDQKVFENRSLVDTNNLNPDEFLLDYEFPLSLGKTWCWLSLNLKSPDPNQVANCEFVGKRMVTNTGAYETPAGTFSDCYELTDYSNGGNIIHWFCSGIGIVFMRFDHAGTRFGFEQTLIDYSLP